MPSFCAVLNCSDKYGHAASISFHKFPFKRKDLLEKWLAFAQRAPDWQPSKWSAICSRHFREDDIICVNERKTLKKSAVPSVHFVDVEKQKNTLLATNVFEKQQQQQNAAVEEQLEEQTAASINSPYTPKINCRLCGHIAAAAVTFATNFEIYGMIQKCFPTLNIQQDDNLPKDMCRLCLKRLESFSRFIDKVLETQSELQRTFRSEKPCTKVNNTERQLKIKQEPVVRVKQEVAEGLDSFLSDDIDMGVDESCDHEQHSAHVEQKFPFGDFPMLNTQDIINNCDIMEIINLDDPFIDIPDDDGNTTTNFDNADAQSVQKQHFPNAQELLQTHLLIEEHNYAYAAEDLKDEWQIKNFYKTEKTEAYEHDEVDDLAHVEHDDDYQNDAPDECAPENVEQFKMPAATGHYVEKRSIKPIVTSVSAIAESRLSTMNGECATNKVPQTITTPTTHTVSKTQNKPNIVVLNESIVKSSSAFQFHACTVCQLKFFSMDTLGQHYNDAHQQPPMVILPSANVSNVNEQNYVQNCKVEEGCERDAHIETAKQTPQMQSNELLAHPFSQQLRQLQNWEANFRQLNAAAASASVESVPKAQHINILEMQQTFLRCQEYNTSSATESGAVVPPREQPLAEPLMEKSTQNEAIAATATKMYTKTANSSKRRHLSYAHVAANYKQLRRRYRQLQRKCKSLQASVAQQPPSATFKRHCCARCKQLFATIGQLLRHKQSKSHYVAKHRHFAATCHGCEKYFRSRLALRNHMRYICQSLSLRWLKTQLQTFKCRCCRSITFTHWRLYRRHELHCKRKLQLRRGRHKQPAATPKKSQSVAKPTKTKGNKAHVCMHCNKSFGTLQCLKQHLISHTKGKHHKCALCARVFKRRNGLTQHMKGFHLQLKPYACPVCKHCYALKCDMLRCRHALMRRNAGGAASKKPLLCNAKFAIEEGKTVN